MIYLKLFYEFFIIGPLLFGGGLTSIPFLKQLGERTHWFTLTDLMNMIAISEITPGPIGVNLATYVGYTIAGIRGGILATFALILPTVIISFFVAKFLKKFRENTIVQSAFFGLRPASLALISAAGVAILRLLVIRIDIWEETGLLTDLFDMRVVVLAVILLILTNVFKKIHPFIFLSGSAVFGIVIL